MADSNSNDKVKELLEKLDEGLNSIFNDQEYQNYLRTMSKFYNYSARNSLLIFMQNPDAELVAGYKAWQSNFKRQVKKGEKGIRIIAPNIYKGSKEMEKIDPVTQKPIMGKDGKPVTESVEITIPSFRATTVFDISQTDGEPLPEHADIVKVLTADVDNYGVLFKALESVSPVPIKIDPMQDRSNSVKGSYNFVDREIKIRDGMSEAQTVKTAIHEIAHAVLHDVDLSKGLNAVDRAQIKDQNTKEVEAESVVFVVADHYGVDTSQYSFGYVAGWSSGKDKKELKASLDIISKTAGSLIASIDEKYIQLHKERETPEKAPDLAAQDSSPMARLEHSLTQIFDMVDGIDESKTAGQAAFRVALKRFAKVEETLLPARPPDDSMTAKEYKDLKTYIGLAKSSTTIDGLKACVDGMRDMILPPPIAAKMGMDEMEFKKSVLAAIDTAAAQPGCSLGKLPRQVIADYAIRVQSLGKAAALAEELAGCNGKIHPDIYERADKEVASIQTMMEREFRDNPNASVAVYQLRTMMP